MYFLISESEFKMSVMNLNHLVIKALDMNKHSDNSTVEEHGKLISFKN